MKRPFAAASLLVVASCAGPAPLVPPQAAVSPPANWREQAAQTAPIERRWWTSFGDPVLSGLVERAVANNTDIAVAAARVRETRAQERLSRSQLLPSVDLGVSANDARSFTPFGTASQTFVVQPAFQAAYEVDLFNRIGSQVEAARQSYLASQAAANAAALSVAAATASSYVTMRALDARVRIARETLVSRAEALRIARDRAEVGYTSQLELRQAEAEYEATAQIIPQAQLAIARQKNALSLLLGESPRAIERGLNVSAISKPAIPDGLPADLLRRRPDIAG